MSALTRPEHEHSAEVERAAMWLSEEKVAPNPVIFVLRQRFNLTALEASEACAMAQRFRTNRKAFG